MPFIQPSQHGAVCTICLDWAPFDDLYVDKDGDRWDSHDECERHERARGTESQ